MDICSYAPNMLKLYSMLVFMHVTSRKVIATRAIRHPDNEWMNPVARCFPSMATQVGFERPTILIRDNDTKFTDEFDRTLKREGIDPHPLPVQAPLMNAHIQRWIKSFQVECLDCFLLVGSKHLNHIISEYIEH